MFKRFRITFFTFVLGFFLSFSAVALAASASSPLSSFGTIYNHAYWGDATVFTDSGHAAGSAGIECGNSAPAGYMGARAYLYRQSVGSYVSLSEWSYNSLTATSWGTSTDWYSGYSDYYRARGNFNIYNGYDYTEKFSGYTPYLHN
ncbi:MULTISPECIES: hypothetical protein [Desulfitobacterium]|uniref:Uncharacterized protein n=1 Tax=Desulfitobacterium dehalogenans (strain ATCC 51507 / DSM 9161 / JW/IU-DC1) TaxID=756499 RepID=I4AB98_DESDJ|nr:MULTISPECIES: hypothetical protein [Desulfitobacterium]AFM01233.1 hypothetical protein Desde_2931 [Desulfitobacterium dehalogenans ATCC 51507]